MTRPLPREASFDISGFHGILQKVWFLLVGGFKFFNFNVRVLIRISLLSARLRGRRDVSASPAELDAAPVKSSARAGLACVRGLNAKRSRNRAAGFTQILGRDSDLASGWSKSGFRNSGRKCTFFFSLLPDVLGSASTARPCSAPSFFLPGSAAFAILASWPRRVRGGPEFHLVANGERER